MGETRGAKRRRPLSRPPPVQVDRSPVLRREQQGRVNPCRMRVERLQCPLSQRDDPQSTRGLAVGTKLPADQDTADVENLRLPVDVTPLKPEQLRGPKPAQGADERDRPVVLQQLGRDGLDLGGVPNGTISVRFGSGFGIACHRLTPGFSIDCSFRIGL